MSLTLGTTTRPFFRISAALFKFFGNQLICHDRLLRLLWVQLGLVLRYFLLSSLGLRLRSAVAIVEVST